MTDPSGLQAVVDAIAADLGCPVLVEDAEHQPLWWSAQQSVDEVRMRTILQRMVAPEARAMVRRLQLARATLAGADARDPRDRHARTLVPADPLGRYPPWLPVGRRRRQPRRLMTSCHGLPECADLAADVLARGRSTYEDLARQRSALLDRLLRGADEQAARELAALEHLAHDVRVVVRVPAQAGGWRLPGGMSAHMWRPRAAPAASGRALPLVDLCEAVRRAACTRRALVAGARLERPSWDALGVWRLVVEAPESLSVSEIHPGAEVLASASRTDLMATARVVLDLGGDVAAAAEALRVHRTTLYYRLDRIQELTGVDLRAGAGRTDLQLALWLAAYRRAGA